MCVCVDKDVGFGGGMGLPVCVCPSVELACHCAVCISPPSLSSVGFLFSVALRACSCFHPLIPCTETIQLTKYGFTHQQVVKI